jgi:hypothetical protein
MPVRKTNGVFCNCSAAATLKLSRVVPRSRTSSTATSKREPLRKAAKASAASAKQATYAALAASRICSMSSAISSSSSTTRQHLPASTVPDCATKACSGS